MRHFCKDHPMVQYNSSRHHQAELQTYVNGNTEEKYVKIKEDAEIPKTKTSKRKRKLSGLSDGTPPPDLQFTQSSHRIDLTH